VPLELFFVGGVHIVELGRVFHDLYHLTCVLVVDSRHLAVRSDRWALMCVARVLIITGSSGSLLIEIAVKWTLETCMGHEGPGMFRTRHKAWSNQELQPISRTRGQLGSCGVGLRGIWERMLSHGVLRPVPYEGALTPVGWFAGKIC
jgi:hypothetical protein